MPRLTAAFVLTAFTMAASTAYASENKIDYIDMQKAVLQTADGQRAQKDLQSEFEKRRDALFKMRTNMEKLNNQFERKAVMLAAGPREKQRLELQAETRKFQEAVAKNQTEMAKRQQDLFSPIAGKITRLAGEVARREGFTLVVDKHAELVVYAAEDSDLTDRIVREYEKTRG